MFLSPYSPARIKESYRDVIVQQRRDLPQSTRVVAKQPDRFQDGSGNDERGDQHHSSTVVNSSSVNTTTKKKALATAFPDSFPLPRILPSVSAVKFSWPGDSYQESDEAFRNFLKRMKPSWIQKDVIAERKQKLKEREHRASVLMGHSRAQGRSTVVQHLVTTNHKISEEFQQLNSKKNTRGASGTATSTTTDQNANLPISENEEETGHDDINQSWWCEGCVDCWEREFIAVFLRPVSSQTGTGYWSLRDAILQTSTLTHRHHPQCEHLLALTNSSIMFDNFATIAPTDDDNNTDSNTSMFSREVSAASIGNHILRNGGNAGSAEVATSSSLSGGTFFPSHHWSAGDFMTTLHVDLEWQYVSETTMKWLRKLPQIQELFLVSVHMTTLDNIELGCPQLQVLSLKRCPCLPDLDGLGKCTNLRDIHIEDCAKLSNVDGLLGCAEFSLETLIIKSCPQLRDISGLDVSGARMLQEQTHYDKMLEAYKNQKVAWEQRRAEYFAKRQLLHQRRRQYHVSSGVGDGGSFSSTPVTTEVSKGTTNVPTLNLGATKITATSSIVSETFVEHHHHHYNEDAALSSRAVVARPSRPGTSAGSGTKLVERVTAQTAKGAESTHDDDDDVFAPWAASSALPTYRNHFNNNDPIPFESARLYTSRTPTNNYASNKSRPTSGHSQYQGGGVDNSRRRSSALSFGGGGFMSNRYGMSSSSMTSTSAFPSFRFDAHRGRSMSSGSAVPFYAMPRAGGVSSSSIFIKRTWKNDPNVEDGSQKPAPHHPLRRLQRRRSSQHVMYIPAAVNPYPHGGDGDTSDGSWDHSSFSSHSCSTTSSSSDDDEGTHKHQSNRRRHGSKKRGKHSQSSSTFEFDVYAVPKQFRPLRKLVLQDCPVLHDVIALRSCVHLVELVIWGCPLIESLRWLQGRKLCEEEDRARIHETTIFRKFMTQGTSCNTSSLDVSSATAVQLKDSSSRSTSPIHSSEFHQNQQHLVGRSQLPPIIGSPLPTSDEDRRSMSGSPTSGLLKQRRQQQHQRQECEGELGVGLDDPVSNERSMRSIRTVAIPTTTSTRNAPSGAGDGKSKQSSYLTTDEVIALLNQRPHVSSASVKVSGETASGSIGGAEEENGESSALKELAQIIKAQHMPLVLPTPVGSLKRLVLHDCKSLYDLEVVRKCDGVESIVISGSTPVLQPPRIPLLYFQQLGLGNEAAAVANMTTVGAPRAGGVGGGEKGVVSITTTPTMSIGSHVAYVGNNNGNLNTANSSKSASPVSNKATSGRGSVQHNQQSPATGKLLPPLSPVSKTTAITSLSAPSLGSGLRVSSTNDSMPLSSALSSVEIFPQEWLYTDPQHRQEQLFNEGGKGGEWREHDNTLILECMQELRIRIGSTATGPASTRQAFTSLKNIIQGCYTSYYQRQIAGGFLQVKCQECVMVDAAGGDVHKLAALRKQRQGLLLGSNLASSSSAQVATTLKLSDNDQLQSLDGISGNFAGNLQVVEIENCSELENIHVGLESRCDRCIHRHDMETAPTILDGKIVFTKNLKNSSSLHPQWLSRSPYMGNITTLSICNCPQLTSLGDLIQQNGKTLRVLTLQFLGSLQTATFNEQLGFCCCLEEVVLCGIPNIQAIEGLSSSRNTLRELALCALPWFSNANFVNLLQCRNQGNNPQLLQQYQPAAGDDGDDDSMDNASSYSLPNTKLTVSGSLAHRKLLTQYPSLTLVIFADCPAISLSQAITDSKRLIPFSQIQSISLN